MGVGMDELVLKQELNVLNNKDWEKETCTQD